MRAAARAVALAPVQPGSNPDAPPLWLSEAERLEALRVALAEVDHDLTEEAVLTVQQIALCPAADQARERQRLSLHTCYWLGEFSAAEREEIRDTCRPWSSLSPALRHALAARGSR